MKNLVIVLIVIAAFASGVSAQYSRINSISRPCPGATTPGRVAVERDGDIFLRPCQKADLSGGVNILGHDGSALLQASIFAGITIGQVGATDIYVEGNNLVVSSSIATVGNRLALNRTITTAGTTGDQTINKIAGTVNIAAGAGTAGITVTNSYANASSIVIATIRTNDATCSIKNVVPGVGSFVIRTTANCTGETSVGFVVLN